MMKKLNFELWWLWIPVAVFSLGKILRDQSLLSAGIYASLFVISFMEAAFHHRQPRVIYAHLNSMLRRVSLLMSITGLLIIWVAVGTAILKIRISDWFLYMAILAWMLIFGLLVVYLLYWSLPYSRKRSGIAAVDAAIERYRKPGEQVGGAWVAPVVIEGKRYRMVVYRGKGSNPYIPNDEPLALEENGTVVRDLELMNKVVQGNRLAWNVSFPEQINLRADGYRDLGKFPVLIERALKKFKEWQVVLGARWFEDLQALEKALVIIGEYMRLQREAYYREAEWGAAHGNTKLKEVDYEDVQKLNDELKPYEVFYKYFDVMKQGVEAAERLSRALQREWELAQQVKDLKYVLHLMREARERVKKTEENLRAGTRETYYDSLSAAEVSAWRARLAWVDVVDNLIAQGHTGKALEAKKQEYLAEQARLERQRQREERARQRVEREAQRKQKQTKRRKEVEE